MVSNDTRTNGAVEIELPIHATAVKGGKLVEQRRLEAWRVRVPANGTANAGI